MLPAFPTGRQWTSGASPSARSEEHTSELQSRENLVCRLLLEKKQETSYCVVCADSPATGLYTLALHDALPIWPFTNGAAPLAWNPSMRGLRDATPSSAYSL